MEQSDHKENRQDHGSTVPLLSYVSAEDRWLKRFIIHFVEWITGRTKLIRLYSQIQAMDLQPGQVWGEALKKLEIKFSFPADQLAAVPSEGPLVIIANHPFGVVDGLLLGHLASLLRPKFHFLVNALLVRQDERLNEFLLPIDFSESKAALKTNLASRQASIDRVRQGEALVIFPAGGVMTAPSGWGRAQELEWKRFTVKMVQQSQATVLPVYFHGQNSRIFHIASRISMTLRLGLLLHEIRNKIGKEVKVVIGKPIPWSELANIKDRQVLLDTLQTKVLSLAAKLETSLK